VAIYDNAGPDQPGNLLAESASQPLSAGWNTFAIPSVSVTFRELHNVPVHFEQRPYFRFTGF
jgi:hypothetical protein